VKTLTMLGAAVVAAGLVPYEAFAAPATTLPAPPGPAAAPAPPAPPAAAAAAAAAEAGRMASEAGRAAGEVGRVEAQLEAARHRLAADADEVARLSMQVGKPLMEHFETRFESSPRALIGVEIAAENRSDGARVVNVSPGGPAFEAGIRPGDLIVSVNDTDAKGEGGANRIVRAIHEAAANSKLNVLVMRQGKPKHLVVTTRAMPNVFYSNADPNGMPPLPGPPANSPVLTYHELGIPSLSNMQLMTLSPGLGRYFGTDKGVLVVRAPTRSDFKLQDGDVILSIDGREPTSGAHATRILASYQAGEKVTLHVMRERKPLSLEVTLPEQKWSYGEFQAPRPTGPNE
jgi:predicted metalloprotease with PDZ domain